MDETKICPRCKSEINKNASICPYCRSPQVTKTRVLLIVSIVLICSVIGVSLGKSISGNTPNRELGGDVIQIIEDLSLEDEITVIKDDYNLRFEGIIKNNTDEKMNYVSLSLSLYDKDGNLLGTAYDNVSDLLAGGTWKFNAFTFLTSEQIKQVARWEVSELRGY